MSNVCTCPKHGRANGNQHKILFSKSSSIYKILGDIDAWKCNICDKYYISTKLISYGNLKTKIKSGELVVNVETYVLIPNKLFVFNRSTKEGLCNCNQYANINFFRGIDKKIYQISSKYCKKCNKYFITEGTLKQCSEIIESNHVEIINFNGSVIQEQKNEQNSNKTIQKEIIVTKENIEIEDLRKATKVAKAYNDAKIDYNPYQFLPWTYIYNEDAKRLLISDEVGLGKTIEAGIIIEEEFSTSSDKNVLVICPAFLRNKWKEELKEKFYQSCIIYGEKKDELQSKLTILPLSRIKRFIEMDSRNFDLIIVDEVHYFKNSKSARYKYIETLLNQNKKSKFVFMSATPLNIV